MNYSTDFKLVAVKLYLKLNSIRKVSNLVNCSKSSLHRWLERYFEIGSVERKEYKEPKSIITKEILLFITKEIKSNPAIILSKIKKHIYKNFNIEVSKSYLFYIIKYKLNITYKQLRLKYYPEKKLQSYKDDKINYYNELLDVGKRNIIAIDETGFYLSMNKNFGRCDKGKRCYKQIKKYPFVKFNFICAIKYGKIVGYKLYKKEPGGIDTTKFNEFYNEFIKGKYKNKLIVMDNAKFHKSIIVRQNIENSHNKIVYILPYNSNMNPIENFFSQLKNHVKNKSPETYEELKKTIDKVIKKKIKEEHIKNYFNYLFIQAEDYINKSVP